MKFLACLIQYNWFVKVSVWDYQFKVILTHSFLVIEIKLLKMYHKKIEKGLCQIDYIIQLISHYHYQNCIAFYVLHCWKFLLIYQEMYYDFSMNCIVWVAKTVFLFIFCNVLPWKNTDNWLLIIINTMNFIMVFL